MLFPLTSFHVTPISRTLENPQELPDGPVVGLHALSAEQPRFNPWLGN